MNVLPLVWYHILLKAVKAVIVTSFNIALFSALVLLVLQHLTVLHSS